MKNKNLTDGKHDVLVAMRSVNFHTGSINPEYGKPEIFQFKNHMDANAFIKSIRDVYDEIKLEIIITAKERK